MYVYVCACVYVFMIKCNLSQSQVYCRDRTWHLLQTNVSDLRSAWPLANNGTTGSFPHHARWLRSAAIGHLGVYAPTSRFGATVQNSVSSDDAAG